MDYDMLMFMHLATVVPAFFIGALLLLIRKGTDLHRRAGRIFMILMIFTAAIALFMPAHVGSRFLGHFGWIHSFCVITLISAPYGWYTAIKGNIRGHKINMILLSGALIIAGAFTFMPPLPARIIFCTIKKPVINDHRFSINNSVFPNT